MDTHTVLASMAIGSMTDLTAFSALPHAPVLPVRPARRRQLRRSVVAIVESAGSFVRAVRTAVPHTGVMPAE